MVGYDQRGTGTIPTRWQKITVSPRWQRNCIRRWYGVIEHYAVVGHALGALVGMQLALDYPASVTVPLISVNGWLRINAHTRSLFSGSRTITV